jgi:serine/threonine protein kinase/Tfp pilus assembly protein PilF
MSGTNVIDDIVYRARQLGPRERKQFIREACGADAALLAHVVAALEDATSDAGHWHATTGAGDAPHGLQTPTLEGQRIGPYRVTRKLGAGGMGDVYLAERDDHEYQQRVAIKLVRAGLGSPQVHSRLRLERQILAKLQHPNIAQLLDGGSTSDGIPYLVMEYIDGEPIDVYCDRCRLSLEARAHLVGIVCAAVHYAHQNLVVHRDLKPNNILITPDGVPKLLDFGIAKLLDTRHSEHTLALTHCEYRVMTPAHASPEQVRGGTITTASDIYVLGVLLYELLTGRRPFQMQGSRMTDIEHMVCELEPPHPSAMVKATGNEEPELLQEIALCRSTTPAGLGKELAGDLDDIIMMAMRKDAAQRYSSSAQLAADLQRHFNGQPVVATSPTWSYRTRKFVARHTVAVVGSVAAMLALAGFSAITWVQSQRIARERDVAAAERVRAEKVSSFLVELFELSDPSKSRGNQVTARELLDVGARRISSGLRDQPQTRTTLLATIGRVYSSLGLYQDSIELLQEALAARRKQHGSKHEAVAEAMVALGATLLEQGDLNGAQALLDDALAMQRSLLGNHALELAATLMARGRLAEQRGALEAAMECYQHSLRLYREHGLEQTSQAASVINDLAGAHLRRSEYERAAALYQEALAIDRRALGEDHPQVAMHVQSLALTLHRQGKLAMAEPLYRTSLQLLQRVLGDRHPHTLDALANYGNFLRRRGDLPAAEAVLRDVLERDIAVRGADHAFVGHDRVNLANLLLDADQPAAAAEQFSAALRIYAQALPADHAFVASALSGLGRAQFQQRLLPTAEQTLRSAVKMGTQSLPADSSPLAMARSALAEILLLDQRPKEAKPLLEQSYGVLRATLGEGSSVTAHVRELLNRAAAAPSVQ